MSISHLPNRSNLYRSSTTKTPILDEIPWIDIQLRFKSTQSDLLFIFDCVAADAFAVATLPDFSIGPENREWSDPSRTCETLASTSSGFYAIGPGPQSFTAAFIFALKELAAKPEGFTIRDLLEHIRTAPRFVFEKQNPKHEVRNEQDSHFLRLRALNTEDLDIYSIPKKRRTAVDLLAASSEDHDKMVKMLLDKGADVNAQGGHFGNALQAASYEGHDQVVQMLLDKGADVNAQGGHFGNALQAALYGGHDQVVQILLDNGADVNTQGGEYGNALQAALARGHDQVVQMLLDKGADVNTQGGEYGTVVDGNLKETMLRYI